MFKRINWKAIFLGITWAGCLCGLVILMGFVDEKKKTVDCTTVKILIPGADNFIEREEIDAILSQNFGRLVGKNLGEINIQSIEERLVANPYIANVKVFVDMDGTLKISIRQREPVLRVINAAGQDFYIDKSGLKMPVSPNFTADVLVANGNIMEPFSGRNEKIGTKTLQDLFNTAVFIKADTLWNAQIEQIFVNENSDIELVPRVGNQKIIIGNADNIETKMKNLLIFYKKAMPKVGWETYKSINVKYMNQIICEKNKIDSTTQNVITEPIVKDSTAIVQAATTQAITNIMNEEVQAVTSGQKTPSDANIEPVKKQVPTTKEIAKPDKKNATEKKNIKTPQNN